MTQADRRYALFALLILVATMWSTSLIHTLAQPQPRLEVRQDDDWSLLEFDNGSQWYIRSDAINSIWAIPGAEAEKLGYQTRIYFVGGTINAPMTVQEIEERLVRGRAMFFKNRLEQLEKEN